ncbi:hypothetical protein NYR77_09585 [Actinobacillus equuli subsp. haemolyticus]|uniref:DUF6716 putative glycosyltransferase n=1 Tax=Actinobacillus equuli TaxID=718 RepID=UPI0024434335|nr:DUF6716 putative glycosyltransferase [Actinobacillus equuli]WGE63020.1 hypothetical protein NYR75_09745 [Actinobacillus equuli subsp. haemolyticus]WGE67223.1 hypothetical protein NYR77_09585 [Actinobacillus equuli subsp. haemolyticus]
MCRVLVIATYDSFLRSGIKVAERISNLDNIEISILSVKKNQLSHRQLLESNAIKYKHIEFNDTLKLELYDIIVLSIGNAATREFIKNFYKRFSDVLEKRPIIISLFPGVIFGHTDSILSRIDADIILANSVLDKEKAEELIKIYHSNARIINYGLINIDADKENIYSKRKSEKNIVFIEQVRIPETKEEKELVIDNLINLAQTYPDKNIIFKRRIANNEKTVHDDKTSYIDIINKKKLPVNFFVSNEPIDSLYEKMDLCLSFSSTVLLEALYYGIPVAIISDFGVIEKYALDKFLGSDLLISFNDIAKGIRPISNHMWLKQNLSFNKERDTQLLELINTTRQSPKRIDNINCLFGGGFRFNSSTKNYKKLRKFFRSPRAFFRDSKLKYFLGKLYYGK